MSIAVEMSLDSGAEAQIARMGRRLGTKARSKVMDRTLSLLREDYHISELQSWFVQDCFAPTRRTTVRLSEDNAAFADALARLVGRGRPAVLMGLVYCAAVKLSEADLESAA